jgi:HAD superfamily hydrolase (TIGR01509 family)
LVIARGVVVSTPALPSLKGVLLDMDGVMVDSEPFTLEALVRVFAESGYTVRHEDFLPFIGTGEIRLLSGVADHYGFPLDVERAKARVYAIYLELIRGHLHALPGVYTFIEECRRRKLRLAVASSADSVKVEGNLRELGLSMQSFDTVVSGSMVARKKPAPDIFLAAADRIGLSACACLVVEDAVAGVAAARAAQARCLALTTSYPAERLQEADWIAPNLAQVPAAVWSCLQ